MIMVRNHIDNVRITIHIYDINNKVIHFKIYRNNYFDYFEIENYFNEFCKKIPQAYSFDYKIE